MRQIFAIPIVASGRQFVLFRFEGRVTYRSANLLLVIGRNSMLALFCFREHSRPLVSHQTLTVFQ